MFTLDRSVGTRQYVTTAVTVRIDFPFQAQLIGNRYDFAVCRHISKSVGQNKIRSSCWYIWRFLLICLFLLFFRFFWVEITHNLVCIKLCLKLERFTQKSEMISLYIYLFFKSFFITPIRLIKNLIKKRWRHIVNHNLFFCFFWHDPYDV